MSDSYTLESPYQKKFEETLEVFENTTVPEFAFKRAKKFVEDGRGDFEWIIDGMTGKSYTYNNFETEARIVASQLFKRGMRKGDTLIYTTFDLVRLYALHCGVWLANGIVRSSYAEDLSETLLERVVESKAKFLLCDPVGLKSCFEVKKQVEWPLEIFVVGEKHDDCSKYEELFEDDGSVCPNLEITPDDICVILCSSGTTGKSKSAVYTHKEFIKLLRKIAFIPWRNINLLAFKATHISGTTLPYGTLYMGKKMIVASKQNFEIIFNICQKYKPESVLAFPSIILGLISHPLAENYNFESVKNCYTGGVTNSPEIEASLKKKIPNFRSLVILYGLTEGYPMTINASLGQDDVKSVENLPDYSLGFAFPNNLIQVRDASGRPLGPNEKGEICSKQIGQFSYYLNDEEETKGAYYEDGYFKSGDLGYYDKDGFLFYVDRMKSVFKCAGNHVSPAELDNLIMQHPAVFEVCVVAIKAPIGDDWWPRAFLTLKKDVIATAEEIKEFANQKLPSYKQLKGGVYIVPDLPKGFSGKITRNLVAKLPVPE